MAGQYKIADNPDALFAEMVEALISTEHAKWVSAKEQTGNIENKA